MGKAVIFSLASLLIIILFVASSSLTAKLKASESEIEITRTRVEILNSVINDFENSYFEKMLYISSKNAIIGISRYYYDNDFGSQYMKKSLEQAMNDVIINGSLYDNKGKFQADLSKDLNSSYTLTSLVNNISRIMDKLGLELTEFNMTISSNEGIKQIDPWTIQIKGEFTYFINDKEKIASWKGFSTKIVNISVIGIYLFDRENGPASISNEGKITGSWKLDNETRQEDSVLNKLGGRSDVRGICISYCQEK
jgi:hypothetical protein